MISHMVLGSGMAGLGADHRLRENGIEAVLFEQDRTPGGHTRTHVYDGEWFFDEGPHVSFTENERVQDLLAESVDGRFERLPALVDNYWRGYRLKHPAICNLHGLPDDLVVDCITDFVAASNDPAQGQPTDYEEWLRSSYGNTFAEKFPMEYAIKVHTTAAKNLGTDWLGPRLYRPDLEQVVRGAISAETEDVHYVTKYRYPTHGGFNSYINPMLAKATLRLDHRVTGIDPVDRVVSFANGTREQYEHLISSIPLPELVPMISGAPEDVIEAASLLTATSMVLVNVGVDREDVGDTWTYFYDPDIVFTRLSYPSSLSPNMAPPGCGSFQAEIYYSDKYKPLDEDPSDLISRTIADLRRTGLILETDQILHQSAVVVPYGNIIHDHDKVPALEAILPWVREQGIHLCGRYGLWGYQWTDEAFVTGEDAAQAALDGTDVAQTMVSA